MEKTNEMINEVIEATEELVKSEKRFTNVVLVLTGVAIGSVARPFVEWGKNKIKNRKSKKTVSDVVEDVTEEIKEVVEEITE